MQETSNEIIIHAPGRYDWSEFTRRPRGFITEWCREHTLSDGEPFNYKTVHMLINGNYCSGAGPKIKEVIRAALAEGLIHEDTPLDKAA